MALEQCFDITKTMKGFSSLCIHNIQLMRSWHGENISLLQLQECPLVPGDLGSRVENYYR